MINQLSHVDLVQYGIFSSLLYSSKVIIKSGNRKELGKYSPHCTRHHAIIDTNQSSSTHSYIPQNHHTTAYIRLVPLN